MNNATAETDRKAMDDADPRLEALLCHLERLVPADAQAAFRRAMVAEPSVDVRVNALIPWAADVGTALRARGSSAPWNQDSIRLVGDDADGVGHSLEFRLGALYVQARATTLAVTLLDPQPGELVLDLAAAPGGKATQIAAAMGNTGLLVANEPRVRRLSSLVGNLERCGALNTLITSVPGAEMARHFHNTFDRVLLDAPCSGDGIVCKDRGMLNWWSPEDAAHKSVQQVGLLRAAFHMLRPGGRLVYSTCSLSTEENEEVLLGLEKRYPGQVEILPIDILSHGRLASDAAGAYPETVQNARRVWPHDHDTEGAFVAALVKKGTTEWRQVDDDAGAVLRAHADAAPADPDGWGPRIEERWDFAPCLPAGHELVGERGHLHLRPVGAAGLADRDWFVRAGMRLAGLHKDHFYLSQQAVTLWGQAVRQRRVELTWPQVQTLFRGEAVEPAPDAPGPGEVLCIHDGLPICRALVEGDGARLSGYVPKAIRTPRLRRLVS